MLALLSATLVVKIISIGLLGFVWAIVAFWWLLDARHRRRYKQPNSRSRVWSAPLSVDLGLWPRRTALPRFDMNAVAIGLPSQSVCPTTGHSSTLLESPLLITCGVLVEPQPRLALVEF
ncbi:hypothetical protein SAMN04487974_1344 [Pelagibacterium luteolum]|uniref:Uncharacterized protein n=1 Tax=Pelagibacterium luteolum TaxID=440168 RepID=A0A1G8AME0_9HYPH|nr:hypothetical protein SAMN04487974_1344 [Pelagibacterium luteolum]